ncbi:MAG: type II secretion system protein [Lachnospiraceae bacterium]|nr:type II secretion system protein [Lachnospiraceae bacterium]
MKKLNKTRAFLTEFIIVILFFSIAAVITIQLYAKANDMSNKNKELIDAVICAQTIAENIKSEIAVYNSEGIYIKYRDKDMNYVDDKDYYEEKVIVSIVDEESSKVGTLYNYEIIIINSDTNDEIYSLVMSKYVSKEVQ